ncbi:hypothetical protein EUX98_g5419 [Antrodiella citrinella]|uniref:Uncharacterized protein n=1 Tax=Antrodiella citrinella TaxID=2447956 RepID=A0A4S4MRS4_9APHY|nr:hypothetical protein EUX98_g5419 [Antrodiella citrinella]
MYGPPFDFTSIFPVAFLSLGTQGQSTASQSSKEVMQAIPYAGGTIAYRGYRYDPFRGEYRPHTIDVSTHALPVLPEIASPRIPYGSRDMETPDYEVMIHASPAIPRRSQLHREQIPLPGTKRPYHIPPAPLPSSPSILRAPLVRDSWLTRRSNPSPMPSLNVVAASETSATTSNRTQAVAVETSLQHRLLSDLYHSPDSRVQVQVNDAIRATIDLGQRPSAYAATSVDAAGGPWPPSARPPEDLSGWSARPGCRTWRTITKIKEQLYALGNPGTLRRHDGHELKSLLDRLELITDYDIRSDEGLQAARDGLWFECRLAVTKFDVSAQDREHVETMAEQRPRYSSVRAFWEKRAWFIQQVATIAEANFVMPSKLVFEVGVHDALRLITDEQSSNEPILSYHAFLQYCNQQLDVVPEHTAWRPTALDLVKGMCNALMFGVQLHRERALSDRKGVSVEERIAHNLVFCESPNPRSKDPFPVPNVRAVAFRSLRYVEVGQKELQGRDTPKNPHSLLVHGKGYDMPKVVNYLTTMQFLADDFDRLYKKLERGPPTGHTLTCLNLANKARLAHATCLEELKEGHKLFEDMVNRESRASP